MANVKLSATELELVTNANFILTKNNIVAKVYDLFGELATSYSTVIEEKNILPLDILKASPKISKGENYEGLPWVMLDCPRSFTTIDVFSIRTFFWWGNFCSITLHVKGKYKALLNIESLKHDDWFICNNQDEWQHHFREDNYQDLSSTSANEIEQMSFIKIAKKIPLNEWDNIEIFCKYAFNQILKAIVLAT